MLISLWTFLLACAAAVQVELFDPLYSNGPETLLVCIPGMLVPGDEYIPVCQEIVRQTPFRTWLAVMSFPPTHWVSTLAVQEGMELALNMTRDSGFVAGNEDVFIWAHSAGAVFSEAIAQNYAAMMFAGSYSADFANMPIPAMVIGGELDGMTQVTKIADEFRVTEALLRAGMVSEAVTTRPVVVLEGVNHAQMCHGFQEGRIQEEDLKPEVTLEEAEWLMGYICSRFLMVQRGVDLENAQQQILQEIQITYELIKGFLDAPKYEETQYCIDMQHLVFNLKSNVANYSIINYLQSDFDEFVESKPALEVTGDNSALVVTQTHLYQGENGTTITSEGAAPKELNCKCKSQEALVNALKLSSDEYDVEGDCRTVSHYMLELALQLVAPQTAERYLTQGRPIEFLEDAAYARGDEWVASSVEFIIPLEEDQPATVRSCSLYTADTVPTFGGNAYCKVWPLSVALQWVMHNSLPRGLD